MRAHLRIRPLLLVLCLLFQASLHAQTTSTASLEGRILDDAGEGIPGVVVRLSNPTVAAGAQTTITDLAGKYAFRLLPPGPGYTLQASVPGYATVIAGPLELITGRIIRQDVTLRPSKELEETVRVEAHGAIVDTSSTKTMTTYGSEFIEGLPLLGRHFNDILTLAPGVTDTDGDGNPNVRGARDTGLQLRLDGTNVSDPLTGHFGQDINLETIEEIEIITSGASAEYGRADGGFANIITKSGGNELQGSVKLFFRSKFLDGNGAGNNDAFPNQTLTVPQFSDTRAFFTLGGAMVKDRLWYFAAIERLDRQEPIVFTTGASALRTLEGWNAFAKITLQAGSANKLALQVSFDPLKRGGNYVEGRVSSDSDYWLRSGGPLFQMRWTSIISPRLLLETVLSRLDGGVAIDPVSEHFRIIDVSEQKAPSGSLSVLLPCRTINCAGDPSIFQFRESSGGRLGKGSPRLAGVSGPFYYKDDDLRERSTLKSDLSYTIDEALGSHAIKSGFEVNDERYADKPINNPILTDATVDASQVGTPGPLTPPYVRYGTLYLDVFRPVRLEQSASGINTAAYLQDSWRPRPNLTINLGLRFDHEEVFSEGFTPFDPRAEARTMLRRFDTLCEAVGNNCTNARVPGRTTQGLPSLIDVSTLPAGDPARLYDLDGDGIVDLYNSSPEFANYVAPLTRPSERETAGFTIVNANLAPRISASWDPWGDGRTKVFGTWNQYFDRLFLGEVTAEQDPDRYTARWQVSGASNQATPGKLSSPLSGVVSVNQVDRNLATPYTIEWSVGLERELAPEWAVTLTYVSRRGKDLLQDEDVNHITCSQFDSTFGVRPYDVCGDGGRLEQDRFGRTILADPRNPSSSVRSPNGAIDRYILNPYWNQILRTGNFNTSRYTSTEVALRKRLRRNWQMQLSYTYSVATGQAEKFADLAGNDPALSDSAFGYLDYDQRHVLKWQAVTRLPHGLVLGSTVQWNSGTPFSVIYTTPDEDDQSNLTGQRILFPSGQKNDQRNGGQWTINARLEKEFRMGRTHASAFLSGENLLDSDDLIIVALRSGTRGDGLDGTKRFGRRWELGLAVEF